MNWIQHAYDRGRLNGGILDHFLALKLYDSQSFNILVSIPPYCLPPITIKLSFNSIMQCAYLALIIYGKSVNALSGFVINKFMSTFMNFLLISPYKICKSIVAFSFTFTYRSSTPPVKYPIDEFARLNNAFEYLGKLNFVLNT